MIRTPNTLAILLLTALFSIAACDSPEEDAAEETNDEAVQQDEADNEEADEDDDSLAASNDPCEGGDEYDNAIIDWIADDFEAEHGVDLREDSTALERLSEEAEETKCELSSTDEVEINLPFLYATDDGPQHVTMTLTREKLEELVDDRR